MDQASAIPRPSGIPRPAPSRLPVLRTTASQSQLRQPASTEQLRKKPSLSSLARPAPPAPALQKKTSRLSLARPSTTSTSTAPVASSNPRASAVSNRRASGIPSFGTKPPAPTSETAFKRPYARPPSRQASKPPPPPAVPDPQEDDALGSLDGFRSASRASSRAGSRAGFRDHEPEPEPEPDHAIEDELEPEKATKKKSRPSLSERTVESIAALTSSPAAGKGRRRSSFFGVDNSMPPPSRPASAMSSNGSRPSTSDGTFHPLPATPKRFGAASGRLSMTAPGRRSISASVSTPTATPTRTPSLRPVSTIKKQPLPLPQNLQNTPKLRPLSESKTMIARTPKSRPSLNGMFGQAVSPPGTVKPAPSTPAHSRETLVKKTPTTARIVSTSSIALREQIAKAKASRKSEVVDEPEQSPKTSSSNVLREQIAKAREAARRAKIEVTRTSTPPRDAFLPDPTEIATFDFGLGDPFNQQAKGNKSVLQRRIDGARTDGRLNIAAMDLKEIPDNVLDMYKYDPNDTTVAWGEIVDLTSIIAADNELETLPEAMFPDVDFETMIDSDEGGPQFGAVQTIDLHGNSLRELPIGLTRLTQLSRLNLSRNKLQMDIFDIITGISSLRELRLADNELQGDVPASISSLAALEVVELQGNKLTSLPIEVRELTCLRVLNISSNQLSSVPMDLFQTGLIELIASKNRFEGAFFTCSSAPNLQELNISNNSLKSLCDAESIDLPALKTLNVSTNRLTSLPSMENWIKLQTLIVGENKLAVFPEGFTTLTELRVADFTANNITQLDERIALMSLRTLILAANPLRERKFLTMSFEDMKRNLASRLPTTEALAADEDEYEFPTEDAAPEAQGWKVTPSGTLDLSSKSLDTIDETALAAVADNMRQLHLQQNTFTCIPAALSQVTFLTVLDLSRNNIETSLTSPLSLLKLKDLRLAANKLSSLDALIAHLAAPALQTLDVSNNRLTGTLPCLHTAFPSLISLLAADNSLSVAPASSLEGLKIVNLANNDIERLDPLISRFQGTLTSLNVEGNKFRVPSWHMLQKGTESVLGWLRERVPVEVPVEVLVDLEDEVATKETNVIRESWKSNSTVFWNADDSGVD